MISDLLDNIKEIIVPHAVSLKLELIDVFIKRRGKVYVIGIVADHQSGGITIDTCTQLNRIISDETQIEDFFDEEYIVEVASPGIDRPLTTKHDFKRVLKRKVRIHLTEKVDGKMEFTGVVEEMMEDVLLLVTRKGNIKVPYDKVHTAVQII
ncbi:MAG: ribosome maturation factor RimP [Candidatus Omnitrophota bacterium]|jgi:ribosome maturation factor RimP